jgi:hypothetical protein
MANILPNLLSQLQEDENKYYLLKDRKLITENNFTILQNDNNSTKLEIIMPTKIGGKELNSNLNYFIDYVDGAGKPGVISNITKIEAVYKKIDNNYEDVTEKITISEEDCTFSLDNEEIKLSNIENNQFTTKAGNTYIIKTNVQYSTNGSTYTSKIHTENFEDSAEISIDYPSDYADYLYFIKASKNLTTATSVNTINSNNEEISYAYMIWTLDKQVTNAAGIVSFSIRIEDNNGYIWQSETTDFTIKPNLKENFYLKKEVEENFIIQNREIKPVGDFKNILVKGDTNSNKLFYKMNRYYQGQDMLAPKQYNNNDVYKTDLNILYYIENDSNILLNREYSINNIILYKDGNTWSYDTAAKTLEIKDNIYSNFRLYSSINSNNGKQYYTLEYIKNNNSTINRTTIESLNSTIILEDIIYNIVIQGIITNYTTNNYDNDKYEDNYNFTTESFSLFYEDRNKIPVFNRLIRFTFLSPNQDYGDWNNGEIEYIDSDYFIFSWTPDARATRSEGELNYYIEFFINGVYEQIEENGTTTTIQTKSYSWSTKPTTIIIEDNKAATANIDYIPHWVSYIENDLQDDMTAFLNGTLQSQYNSFEEYLIYTILGDYTELNCDKTEDNNYNLQLENNNYNILLTSDNLDGNKYIILITNETENTNINLISLNKDNIYSGVIQLDNINYYIIYNSVTTQLKFYQLENNNDISTPYLEYAKEKLETLLNEYNSNYNTIENNFSELQTKVESSFGVSFDENNDENNSLYTIIWNYFNNLGNTLQTIYNSQSGSPIKLKDINNNEYEVNGETMSFIINDVTYYYQIFSGLDRDNSLTTFIQFEEDKNKFFKSDTYYIDNNDNKEIINIYKEDLNYYKKAIDTTDEDIDTTDEKNDYELVTFSIKRLYLGDITLTAESSDYVVFSTYYFTLSTLSDQIQQELAQTQQAAADSFTEAAEELKDNFETKTNEFSTVLAEYESLLEDKYNTTISDFYNIWSAYVNSNTENATAMLQAQINELLEKEKEHSTYTINASANTLIISGTE